MEQGRPRSQNSGLHAVHLVQPGVDGDQGPVEKPGWDCGRRLRDFFPCYWIEFWLISFVVSGKPFLDFSLVELNSKREMRLSDLVQKAGSRPLVLNFGSCSWPPFMAKLGEFEALADKACTYLWFYDIVLVKLVNCYVHCDNAAYGQYMNVLSTLPKGRQLWR